MSGQCEATRQSDFILPMVADSNGKANGFAVPTSTTVAIVDLTTVPGLPGTFGGKQTTENPNPIGHYLDLVAEGADAYFIFGPTKASVTGANAPVATTTTTPDANGVITPAVGVTGYLPASQKASFKIPIGAIGTANGPFGQASPMRFLAVVTKSGTGILRGSQSSE